MKRLKKSVRSRTGGAISDTKSRIAGGVLFVSKSIIEDYMLFPREKQGRLWKTFLSIPADNN